MFCHSVASFTTLQNIFICVNRWRCPLTPSNILQNVVRPLLTSPSVICFVFVANVTLTDVTGSTRTLVELNPGSREKCQPTADTRVLFSATLKIKSMTHSLSTVEDPPVASCRLRKPSSSSFFDLSPESLIHHQQERLDKLIRLIREPGLSSTRGQPRLIRES